MERSARQLLNNLGSLVLALLLAFVVWIAATLQADPFETQTLPGMQVVLLNQPDNTRLLDLEPAQVAVSVRAQKQILGELETSDFQATVDLSNVELGKSVAVPIQVACSNQLVRIGSWIPSRQTIHLEAMGALTLPVAVELEGQVSTGYQAAAPAINPGQVSIYGPQVFLSEVVSVTGTVDVAGARDNVLVAVDIAPVDTDGKVVAGLEWSPSQVEVRVAVSRRLGFKPDVEVVPDLRGEPAPGYRLGSVAIQPSTVTLAGLPSVLDKLPGFVETMPILVTGATQDLSHQTALTLPTSVAVVGGNFVTVTVEVLAIQSSRAMTASVGIQGVAPGWIAIPSPAVVDVILEGPDNQLTALKAEDVQIVLNLFGYGLGVHRIQPRVLAPEGVRVVSVIPETIEVSVALGPTAVPAQAVTPIATSGP